MRDVPFNGAKQIIGEQNGRLVNHIRVDLREITRPLFCKEDDVPIRLLEILAHRVPIRLFVISNRALDDMKFRCRQINPDKNPLVVRYRWHDRS